MTIQPSASLSEFSTNGANYKSFPTNIFQKLRNATTEVQTLQATVEIIYETLRCDRVVVYSMQSPTLCKITAEVVTPGYAQILDTTLEDPCFKARYIDKYQKGRVRAITNIREAGMSLCYIENLEKIDVKSNLVVPLNSIDNSLYGLLVMHQCSRTREWQQTEVEFVLGVANWTMNQIAQQQERLRLQEQIHSNEQTQQLLTSITQEIYRAATSEEVLQVAVDKAKEILNCDRVIIYGLQSECLGEIVAEATTPSLASILANVIKDPCFEYRYINYYEQGRVRATSNIYEAGMSLCYVDNLAKIGVKANLVVPINWDSGKIYGLLVAHHCFDFKDWQKSEIEHLKQIGFHTGLSLSKTRFKEQSFMVETGMKELNNIQDSINHAQVKIEQMETPIQNTNKILVEVNNLNRLLEREINAINQNSSLQTRKDIKLIHLIIRKLAAVSFMLKESLNQVSTTRNEVKNILEMAKKSLTGNQSDKN
jgi:GAF domain-containing protein